MMKMTMKYLGCLLVLFASTNIFAQTETEAKDPVSHERMYQVELIIFSRGESNSQERWPNNIKLSYPTNASDISSDANPPEGITFVPNAERLLNPQALTLARSGSYTLLYHQAWRQMIYANKRNLIITGGKVFNGHHELEGSISLSVAQFLKIQTNLWLTQFTAAGTPVTETWPELPELPGTMSDIDKPQDYLVKRIVKITEKRAMRSNEVHYIDHPLLGIIIKIVPYEPQATKP